MAKYPKPIKRLLREFNGIAYERELRAGLERLDQHFAAWRASEIDSVELAHYVHTFERGRARELFSFYFESRDHEHHVAYAIAVGIIDPAETPPGLLESLEKRIERYKKKLEPRDSLPPEETPVGL